MSARPRLLVPTFCALYAARCRRRSLKYAAPVSVQPTSNKPPSVPALAFLLATRSVLNTDGTSMLVKDALKLVNQVREEITSTGDADYDSETRFALDWFAAKGFDKGKSGDAIVMTNAVDVSLDG